MVEFEISLKKFFNADHLLESLQMNLCLKNSTTLKNNLHIVLYLKGHSHEKVVKIISLYN
jgi:hypothetical protein